MAEPLRNSSRTLPLGRTSQNFPQDFPLKSKVFWPKENKIEENNKEPKIDPFCKLVVARLPLY